MTHRHSARSSADNDPFPQTRQGRIAAILSLNTASGRIGLIVVVVALTLITAPFLLGLLSAQTEPAPIVVNSDEAWPTAPAAYVAPAAPPALGLRSEPTPIPLPAPQWRDMSHLTVVELLMSSIVNVDRRSTVALLGEVITDQLLLKATGKIQLGIDLSQVHDVEIDGGTIRFKAPKPEVVSVELLPEKSQIYDRRQVLFLSNYTGLETEALEVARQQLRSDVIENSAMLALAEEYGRLKLAEFLRNVGYTDVEVTFVEGSVQP